MAILKISKNPFSINNNKQKNDHRYKINHTDIYVHMVRKLIESVSTYLYTFAAAGTVLLNEISHDHKVRTVSFEYDSKAIEPFSG